MKELDFLDVDIKNTCLDFISDYNSVNTADFANMLSCQNSEFVDYRNNFAHYLLINNDTSYDLSRSDIEWIKNINEVFIYKAYDDINLFFISLGCKIEDNYLICAACIKIINRIYDEKNFFIFNNNGYVSFGMKRLPNYKVTNNFIVTDSYSEDEISLLAEIIEQVIYLSYEEIPDCFKEYSTAERSLNKKRYYENTAQEDDSNQQDDKYPTYSMACDELKNIAEDNNISSLDAIIYVENSDIVYHKSSNEDIVFDEEVNLDTSINADDLLEELLKK